MTTVGYRIPLTRLLIPIPSLFVRSDFSNVLEMRKKSDDMRVYYKIIWQCKLVIHLARNARLRNMTNHTMLSMSHVEGFFLRYLDTLSRVNWLFQIFNSDVDQRKYPEIDFTVSLFSFLLYKNGFLSFFKQSFFIRVKGSSTFLIWPFWCYNVAALMFWFVVIIQRFPVLHADVRNTRLAFCQQLCRKRASCQENSDLL